MKYPMSHCYLKTFSKALGVKATVAGPRTFISGYCTLTFLLHVNYGTYTRS